MGRLERGEEVHTHPDEGEEEHTPGLEEVEMHTHPDDDDDGALEGALPTPGASPMRPLIQCVCVCARARQGS